MTNLPHSLINHILTFVLQPQEINLLKGINLEISDINILENKNKNHINLLKEFQAKTAFWRIKWLNKSVDLGSSGDDEDEPHVIKYQSNRTQLNFVCNYWNYHYPNYFAELSQLEGKNNCEEEYITDFNKGSANVFKNLMTLKHYMWSDKHKTLFKPGIKERRKPVWKIGNTMVMEGDL